MDPATILELVKARLGITTTVRDVYLTAIINGIIDELQNIQGITLAKEDHSHLMFVADYAEFRYSNRDSEGMPRHLQWRLNNLYIRGEADV